jgi:hypothetical protein
MNAFGTSYVGASGRGMAVMISVRSVGVGLEHDPPGAERFGYRAPCAGGRGASGWINPASAGPFSDAFLIQPEPRRGSPLHF